MLKSSRRWLNGAKQDDVVYTAEPVEAGDVFDADTYDLPTPTFFPQAFREMPVSRLADRYRSARELPPMPDVLNCRPGQSRPVAHYPVRAARYRRDLEDVFEQGEELRWRTVPAAQPAPEVRGAPRSQAALFIAAGLVAIMAGGGLGYLTTWLNHGDSPAGSAQAAALAAPVSSTVTETAVAASPAPAGRKPIAMAKLDVADVSGSLNSLIPLALHADETGLNQDIVLKLSGLPKSAHLTAGAWAKDSDDWQLAAADAVGVKLVVPRSDSSTIHVGVTAVATKTGEMVAPMKEMTIALTDAQVVPASAPPETAVQSPAPAPDSASAVPVPTQARQVAASPVNEAQNLISKGDYLLKSGDLAMARQFYERAYAEGEKAAAAMGAGKTFDPVVYAQLKVQGLQPDPQQALDWYQRAKDEGSPEADAAIETLKKTAP